MTAVARLPGVFLTGQWRWLAMLNFEVDPAILEKRVPKGTSLDRHDGKVFVSLVGFLFRETCLLGMPIPWHQQFEEVNLRFYVRREVGGEVRRGVVFIREIAPRRAVALVARWIYNEPYLVLPMRHAIHFSGSHAPGPAGEMAGETPPPREVSYQWRWRGKWNELHLAPKSEGALPLTGSHEEFITEHYFGYNLQKDGSTAEYRVDHPIWRQWQASESYFNVDVASLYGEEFAPFVRGKPYSALLADGSPFEIRRLERIA